MHGSIKQGKLIEADSREELVRLKACVEASANQSPVVQLSRTPLYWSIRHPTEDQPYRSTPVAGPVHLPPIELHNLRCPACGRRKDVSWSMATSLILNHRAARCTWWRRRLLGCRERRPHFHLACVCGERWILGHATST